MSVGQAIVRKVFAKAVNGNTRSQRTYLDYFRESEASRTRSRTDAFASYDRAGVDRPEQVPHPDHVNINYETGDLTITGSSRPNKMRLGKD